jgi:hypothetical protein
MAPKTTSEYPWGYFSVAPSVERMTQLSYDDLGSVAEMHDDCEAAVRRLPAAAPSLQYADFPRDVPKPEIQITEAATRIANALQLHLD